MPNMGTKMPNMGIASIKSKQDQPLSMVDALFSKTQQNVLALLYGQPEQSFYTNEIIKKSGGGSGAVQRELSRLVRSGLATVTRIGSQNHYQANAVAPIYEELCKIIRKTVGLVEPIRQALKPLSDHIDFAFVFGSVAKKKDSAFSDIDLLIVSESLTYADVYPALEEVSHQFGRDIQPTIYSPSELKKRIKSDSVFIRRVLEQPKLWVIGQESELPTG
jgi:predicted nucleotidyltransferase